MLECNRMHITEPFILEQMKNMSEMNVSPDSTLTANHLLTESDVSPVLFLRLPALTLCQLQYRGARIRLQRRELFSLCGILGDKAARWASGHRKKGKPKIPHSPQRNPAKCFPNQATALITYLVFYKDETLKNYALTPLMGKLYQSFKNIFFPSVSSHLTSHSQPDERLHTPLFIHCRLCYSF